MNARTPLPVEDQLAIAALCHRYIDAVVHRDADAWGAGFAEDALWSLGPGHEVTGRTAIVELWTRAMGGMEHVVQMLGSGDTWAVDGHPDRAEGRWYFTEHYRMTGKEPGVLLAQYDDTYVRDADGWRFASRRLTAHTV